MKQILTYQPRVRSELRAYIRAKKEGAGLQAPWRDDFLERLLPYAAAGKLLRGGLVCFSYETFAGKAPDTDVISAAVALELTHSALLIHDDIMDDDGLRRGQPSMHAQYQALASGGLSQPEQFGAYMALCGGDVALFMAAELLGGMQAGAKVRQTVWKLFTDQLITTCAGQMQDLYFEARRGMPPQEEIYNLMATKTAAYTIALPLAMGAALAKQPAGILGQLQAIGIDTGMIFQIRDDELGVMGDTKQTGKPVGSDIIEGKKTLLYYHLLEQCSPAEREKITAIFGNQNASANDIAYIQQLVGRYDISGILNNEIGRLEQGALQRIGELPIVGTGKKELRELVRFCGKRQS